MRESQRPRLFLTSSSDLCPSVYSLSRHCPGPALSSSATGHTVPITGSGLGKRRAARAAVGSGGSPGGPGLLPAEGGVTLAGRAPREWMLSEAADAAGASHGTHTRTWAGLWGSSAGPAQDTAFWSCCSLLQAAEINGCGGAAGRCPMDVLWQCPGDMRARLGRLCGVSPLRAPQPLPPHSRHIHNGTRPLLCMFGDLLNLSL